MCRRSGHGGNWLRFVKNSKPLRAASAPGSRHAIGFVSPYRVLRPSKLASFRHTEFAAPLSNVLISFIYLLLLLHLENF